MLLDNIDKDPWILEEFLKAVNDHIQEKTNYIFGPSIIKSKF